MKALDGENQPMRKMFAELRVQNELLKDASTPGDY